MDAGKLKKYRRQLRSRTPLIGGWLQAQALKTLAEDGSAEAVRLLAETAVHGDDDVLHATALGSLRQLAEADNVPAREALCRLVIHHDHPEARALVFAAGYLPHDEVQRALFYFLTDQWQKYEGLDFDHRLLREAYDAGDADLRSRIAAKARQAGRLEWVEVVSGGKQGQRLALMTDEEWQTALTVLEASERYADLWRLAQEGPPRWGAVILRRLKRAGWRPPEADRDSFDDLVALARKWNVKGMDRLIYHRATLEGHSHEVRCLAVSPSGRLLASGSADRTARLWSLPDGTAVKTLKGHTGWVNCLAISPDGRLLASAGRDGRVCLWHLPDGAALARLKGHTLTVFCLAVSPDGRLLASGSSDGTVCLWSLPEGELLHTLKGHNAGITCLAISPDSQLLATGSGDSTVRLWSLWDGHPLRTLEGHRGEEEDGVLCLAISPDGRLLASGGTDHRILLWSLPDGRLRKVLKTEGGHVTTLAITPDGTRLVSGSDDHLVRLWRLPGGRALKTLGGQTGTINCLALSSAGRLLACSSGGGLGIDHTVRLWSLPGGKVLRTLVGHTRYVNCLALSPDGRLLASGSGDGTIRLWSAELERLGQLPVAQAGLQDLEWVQATLRDERLAESERAALSFLAALMRRHRRLDVLLDGAAPRVIELGAFDIEIEG
jgi:sugar lactone lactonase YvrE